jgi:hypothetical protein
MNNIISSESTTSRRNFLHKAILAITGSTILSQTNTAETEVLSFKNPDLITKQTSSSGYHETEHIRNYYKSTGL